jgi:hypothetical protein
MIWRGELIALGDGGRKEPHRYFFHPMFLAVREKSDPEVPPLQAAFNADPGAELAVATDATKFRISLKRMVDQLSKAEASSEPRT